MIGRLSGRLLAKHPPTLLVDVGGVGYELEAPMSTIFELPAPGSTVTLLTHLLVREDAQLLFGFGTEAERDTFRKLIRISGIGARIALALLSGMSVSELGQAVGSQDSARLMRVPGIGRKTAERLLLELKGKALASASGLEAGADDTPGATGVAEVSRALIALGYSEREAAAASRDLAPDVDVSEGIRQALKALSRS